MYRKPTHTDQYLNFRSNHQVSAKESVVSALFTRADNIISEPIDLRTEQERIIKVLTDNDYNKQIITKVRRNIEKRNHSYGGPYVPLKNASHILQNHTV